LPHLERAMISFRQRFREGMPLIGTFVRLPVGHTTEILGEVGFDFVVIDEEHAPFDRSMIDTALLAARAAGTAGIVRVANSDPSTLLSALDCGATGVIVPHVSSVAIARDVVAACRYRPGRRGFTNVARAGRYGSIGIREHIEAADSSTTVIAMIEDPEAVENIDAIIAVEGIDGVFIGVGDLTVAMGATALDASEVQAAVKRVAEAVRAAQKTLCMFCIRGADIAGLKEFGATVLIVSSDQGLMRQAATAVLADARKLLA